MSKYKKIIEPALGLELDTTLNEMERLAQYGAQHYLFQTFVNKTFGNLTGKEFYRALWNFTRKSFKYIQDELDEVLTAPQKMLLIKAGDCDDFSIFIKAVLIVKNENSFFLLMGKAGSDFSHVAIITESGFVIDATNNKFNEIPDFMTQRKKVIFKG